MLDAPPSSAALAALALTAAGVFAASTIRLDPQLEGRLLARDALGRLVPVAGQVVLLVPDTRRAWTRLAGACARVDSAPAASRRWTDSAVRVLRRRGGNENRALAARLAATPPYQPPSRERAAYVEAGAIAVDSAVTDAAGRFALIGAPGAHLLAVRDRAWRPVALTLGRRAHADVAPDDPGRAPCSPTGGQLGGALTTR